MPSQEVLVLQTGVTKLCDRNPRRTVLVITNIGTNGATRINIMDEAKQQWPFILTNAYEFLVLKASEGFDVTHEWYAYATGTDEYVNVFEDTIPKDLYEALLKKGITSTSGMGVLGLITLGV